MKTGSRIGPYQIVEPLGAGVSDDFGLAFAWAMARTLRLADGPDEVHREAIARLELKKYEPAASKAVS